MKSLVYSLIGLALVGCATKDQYGIVTRRGDPPTTDQINATVQQYLQANLKDADSMKQLSIRPTPQPVNWDRGLINGGGTDQGWMLCFEYNAKNSYGGYTGVHTEGLVVRVYGSNVSIITTNWRAVGGC